MFDIRPGLPYLTSKVTFGKNGVEKECMVEAATNLKREIQSGLDYAATIELAWVRSKSLAAENRPAGSWAKALLGSFPTMVHIGAIAIWAGRIKGSYVWELSH